MKPALLTTLLVGLLSTLLVGGCGGEEVGPDDPFGDLKLSSTSSDYNGSFSDYKAKLEREVRNDETTLIVTSGFRRFRLILREDVLKKGQVFNLDDTNDARATYDEGSDKVWVAYDGRAEVTEELLGNFTIRLRDLKFDRTDDDSNQALGTFDLNGRLVRR